MEGEDKIDEVMGDDGRLRGFAKILTVEYVCVLPHQKSCRK